MAEEEKSGKKFPLLLVVGLIVAGLVLAGGVSYFIAMHVMNKNAAQTEHRDPGVFVKLGDPKEGLIVNVGGVNTGRYLKIGVVLELSPDSVGKDGKIAPANETKILDAVLQVLRAKKAEDFDTSKQGALKINIKEEVNKAFGKDCVYEVYITTFVLQ